LLPAFEFKLVGVLLLLMSCRTAKPTSVAPAAFWDWT
jgi:hypothetical protein